jgi:hypothetical protein
MHFLRKINPGAKLILDALARGEDPLETVPIAGVLGAPGSNAGKGQTISIMISLHYFSLFPMERDIY